MKRADLKIGEAYAWDSSRDWESQWWGATQVILADLGPFRRSRSYATEVAVDGETYRRGVVRDARGLLVAVRLPGVGSLDFVPAAQLHMTWDDHQPWKEAAEARAAEAEVRRIERDRQAAAHEAALIARAATHGVTLGYRDADGRVTLPERDLLRLLDLADQAAGK
jgi:hypothetical protein